MRKVGFTLYIDGKNVTMSGEFHQWGIESEELNDGILTNTVAIIECEEDGVKKVYTPLARNVIFLTD